MILGPNDNPVSKGKSDSIDGDFGGSRKVTKGRQRKTQDYKKPTETSVDIEESPVDTVTKDIDEMTDSKERKREFSKLADLASPADTNKDRFVEIGLDNKPHEDTSAVIIPDDKHRGAKIKGHFGSGQYEGEVR